MEDSFYCIKDHSIWMTSQQHDQLKAALFDYFLKKYIEFKELQNKPTEQIYHEEMSQIMNLLVELFQYDRQQLILDAETYYHRVHYVYS